MRRSRRPEGEPPVDAEQQDRLQRLAEEAGWLVVNEKIGETEAIGRVLNRSGVRNEEDRRRYFRNLLPIIRRAGIATLAQDYKRRKRTAEARMPQAQAHAQWTAEAERAGFDDADELLHHLNT